MVALAVEGLFPSEFSLPVGAVWDVGDRALVTDAAPHAVSVIALVGDDNGAALQAIEQRLGTGDIMVVARRDQEADRAAFRVDPRVDLRGEAAAASPHTTISTLFLTPEAC